MFAYALVTVESAADIVRDDCFIFRCPRHFNTAVRMRKRILVPWQLDANFHPFLGFFREALCWLG